jgi:hypothetical protein
MAASVVQQGKGILVAERNRAGAFTHPAMALMFESGAKETVTRHKVLPLNSDTSLAV